MAKVGVLREVAFAVKLGVPKRMGASLSCKWGRGLRNNLDAEACYQYRRTD